MAFQGRLEGETRGRRAKHYEKQWNDRPKLRGDRFIIATHPRSRLNKAGPRIFLVFQRKAARPPALLLVSLASLNPPLSSFYCSHLESWKQLTQAQ